MTRANDTVLLMQVLSAMEAGQSARAIHSGTGIPKLLIDRVRKLHQHAPTLLIAVAAGNLSITAAFHQLKQREAQPCP